MAFEFRETFEVYVPDVEEQLAQFSESNFSETHGLVIEIAAIHEGTTGNFTHYSARELEKALNSWLAPYPKPVIMNHDQMSEPVGRIVGARMDEEEDGTPFVRLQAAITDTKAIEKVSDKRYLTGSVGGKADEAICNICDTDWANPKEGVRGAPCAHRRGKAYKGEIATIKMQNINFVEYSFVNTPADKRSGVREVDSNINESEWAKPTRFFVLGLEEEQIVEFTESDGTVDILGEMKKKEASPKYHEMKGAFIEAQVVNKIEEDGVKRRLNDTKDSEGVVDTNSEENEMANEDAETTVDENDILAVTEQLSEDIAAQTEESEEEPTEESEEIEESETEEVAETEESEETEETENDTEIEEESEEIEEGERPQGQEKDHGKDIDPENSEGAPQSRESDEDTEDAETVEESDESDESDEETVVTEETEADESADEAELANEEEEENSDSAEATEAVDEILVDELKSEVEALEEENGRLKSALHLTLVERVVDRKIQVGMVATEGRVEAIEEHADRSAGSLADSLRDMADMPSATSAGDLEIHQESVNVDDEDNVTTIGEDEDSDDSDADPTELLENTLVASLMGRRKNQL